MSQAIANLETKLGQPLYDEFRILVMSREPLCEGLVEIEGLPFSRIRRTVGLFYRKDVSLSAGARKFVNLCKEQWS